MSRGRLAVKIAAGLLLFGCGMSPVACASASPPTWTVPQTTPGRAVSVSVPALAGSVPQVTSTPGPEGTSVAVHPTLTAAPTGTRQRFRIPRVGTRRPATTMSPEGRPTPIGSVGGLLGGSATPNGTPTPVATRYVGLTNVPASPPFEPLLLVTDEGLRAVIEEYLGEEVVDYGLMVKRLSDGKGVAVNADKEFYAASLFKILVMYEVFRQRELGLLSFDESLVFSPPYLEYGLGTLRWPLWSHVPIWDLLEAMVTESDNVAAIMLQDRVGGWNIIQDYQAIGLKHTVMDREQLVTSAGDMALWLEMISRGQELSEKSREQMIELLAGQLIDDRLPKYLPEGIKVAHKTGNWDNATHDVGIVYAPSGAYVIAALSNKYWESEPIAELSARVYEYFEEQTASK
ncbi:MAG: serine hydrolase [Chloroflexota bacterium]